jgi:hypothetical protein
VIRLVRWLVRLEIGIWRSLFLWVARRVPGRGPDAEDFGYAKEVTPLLLVFVFLSALEIPVVHLLIPWAPVKLALLIVGVWGVLWMIGYLAGMRVFRHLIDEEGLRIRQGPTVDFRIPWDAVADVRARRDRFQGRSFQVVDGVAYVPVLNQTRVSVKLSRPVEGAEEVRFYADDARAFVAAAKRRAPRPPRADHPEPAPPRGGARRSA